MKRKIVYYLALILIVLWSCNGKTDKSVLVVSVADLAIQSKLEIVSPSDSVDSVWVESLKTLHELDQNVCILAAQSESGTQSAQLIGVASAQGEKATVRVMNSCCPCSGICCGCIDYSFAASSSDVSALTLTSEAEPEKTITAKSKEVSGINVFNFNSSEIKDGNYTMTIKRTGEAKEIQFNITFEDSKWTVEKKGFQKI